MRSAGLFAGIGGFEVGFAAAGHECQLLCEIHRPAQAVLRRHFPDVEVHADVCSLEDLPQDVELLCAGFPCQDLSQAGKTAGIGGSRSALVGEVFRLLAKRRVPWVVLENVPFMLQLSGGRALSEIVYRLEDLGYRWAYRVMDTLAFGLPQRRERVFLVASIDQPPENVLLADEANLEPGNTDLTRLAHGFYWTEGTRGLGWAVDAIPTLKNGSTIGIPSPPAILLPTGSIIKPDIRDAERLQGFVADWTRPAEEVSRASSRWSLVGNAVSVPVARWLGERMSQPGEYRRERDRPLNASRNWPKAARFDGRLRHSVSISTAPTVRPRLPLSEFLEYPGALLSQRATAGFLKRARSSSLRFPIGFLDAVASHMLRVSSSTLPLAAE